MNTSILIGNMARNPELRYTNSGKAVCNFTVAVNKGFGKDEADFINCVAWEKTAENIANYLAKGKKVAVRGRIQVSSYDKDGEKRYKTEVVAQEVQFLSPAGKQEAPQRDPQEEAARQNEAIKEKESDDQIELEDFKAMDDDEDLPF